ncbi:MAG: hypothetical protein IKV57_07310 [Clostridia bacterium]|nr:hypothetical protein [Clostridia bacterium]
MHILRKRMWMTGLFLLTVWFFLLLPAGAEPVRLSFADAYVLENVESGEIGQYLTGALDDFSGRWEFLGDTGKPEKQTVGGMGMLFTEGKDTTEGYMEFQYLETTDLSEVSSLVFGLYITDRTTVGGMGEDGIPRGIYQISMTVGCGGTETMSQVYLEGNRWYIVCCDLPDEAKSAPVSSLKIRIRYGAETSPGPVRITSPGASDRDCRFVSTFSATRTEAVRGDVIPQSDRIHLRADSGGNVVMTADVNLPMYVQEVTGWYLAVTVEGAAAGGELSAGILYNTGEEDPRWLDTAYVDVLEGRNTYYFPMPLPRADMDTADPLTAGAYGMQTLPDPVSCRLAFRDVTGKESSLFRVRGVEWIPVLEPAWEEGTLGSMTEGTVQNGELQWTGKLTRQSVIEYIDADIALMAVPVWDRYSLENAKELAVMKVSNSFTFTLDAESAAMYAAGWMFFSAIRVEKETQDPTVSDVRYLPVSRPKMLAGTEPAPCVLSMFGIHSANAVGVFESNVSHVTVDVQLDQLVQYGSTGVVCTYGGKSCTLSQAYLSQLDSDILFYSDAGLEVSLRLLSADPYLWSEKQAENYLPLTETETDLYTYAAVLSYLCERYPAVASITLGKGINCEKYTGFSLEKPEQVMKKTAILAAVTYQTARLVIPDIYIVVPLADSHVYQSEEALPDYGTILSPEWALLLFAEAMESLGNVPWVASWRFESDGDLAEAASLPGRLEHMLHKFGLPVFSDFLYRWEPESCLRDEPVPYSFTERYENVCAALAAANPRAVILSFARISDYVSQSMFAEITGLPDPSGDHLEGRQVQKFTGTLTEGGVDTASYHAVLPVWDFAASYSTEEFVAGGGIEEIFTSGSKQMDLLTGRPGSRVLRSILPVSLYEGSAVGMAGGVLLRNFDGVLDLSGVDTLQFTFTLTEAGQSAASPTVVFLLGADDWRAEYHVRGVLSDTVMTVSCDLREYVNAARTEYIGVMIYGETDLVFDLASVYACSTEGSAEALEKVFTPTGPEPEKAPYAAEIFYILLLLALFGVSGCVLLFRRDREAEEENHEFWK